MKRIIIPIVAIICLFVTSVIAQEKSVLKKTQAKVEQVSPKVVGETTVSIRPGYMRVQGYKTVQVPTYEYIPVDIETQVTITPRQVVVPQTVVRPAPRAMIVPRRPAPMPKPAFRTPIRNGIWYGGVAMNRAMWNNRYHRYNKLGRKLNAQPVPLVVKQPNYPY